MLFLISNILAWFFVIVIFGFSMLIQHKSMFDNSIFIITLVALFTALSVVLNNLLGYSISLLSLNIKLSLGNFVIFLAGMLFGPFYGFITGLASDTIGIFANIGGAYSAIFTLDHIIYGFFGGLVVYFWGNKKHFYSYVATIYALIFLLISFGTNLLWLYIVYGSNIVKVSLIPKFIKAIIEIPFYIFIIETSFSFLDKILKNKSYHDIWYLNFYKNPKSILKTSGDY